MVAAVVRENLKYVSFVPCCTLLLPHSSLLKEPGELGVLARVPVREAAAPTQGGPATPVEPKPPAPRSVASRSSTSSTGGV